MLKSERYQDAFQRAIQIKDNVKVAWQGLADAQEQLGETEQAAASRQRAESL